MNFASNQMFINFVILTIICVFVFLIFRKVKETFKDFDTKDLSCDFLEKKYLTTDDFLANGAVYKYRTGEEFTYMYHFNLPNPIGGDYNNVEGEYTVLAGSSKDDLKPLGVLKRSGDGDFKTSVVAKEDFVYTKIQFNDKKNNVVVDILDGYI